MSLTLPMRAKNSPTRRLFHCLGASTIMIELLRERDNWTLAQLCVAHMQYSKADYLGRVGADQ